jgi:hypothetical protein
VVPLNAKLNNKNQKLQLKKLQFNQLQLHNQLLKNKKKPVGGTMSKVPLIKSPKRPKRRLINGGDKLNANK